MISLRPLIINPKSPDKALQQAYSEAESALARIAHVNRLSRDIMDIKYYELDLQGGTFNTLRISSKKGIVEVVNYDDTSDTLIINLNNPEITLEKDDFYMQLSVYANGGGMPVICSTGFVDPNAISLKIKDLDGPGTFGNLYFYYELVKI